MSFGASLDASAEEDLGGGFKYVRRHDGDAAITVPLGGDAYVGLMSPGQLNARDEDGLASWLRRWTTWPIHGLRSCQQAHTSEVLQVDPTQPAPESQASSVDGMWTTTLGVGLVVKAADCAPIWIADRGSKRLALLHAGWRGVAGGIIDAALMAMMGGSGLAKSRARKADLVVSVGPHLQACCFEVGPEVAEQFSSVEGAVLPASSLTIRRRREDSAALNLAAFIAAAFRGWGIQAADIHIATACTRCQADVLHSYRRNGTGGPLMAAFGVIRA